MNCSTRAVSNEPPRRLRHIWPSPVNRSTCLSILLVVVLISCGDWSGAQQLRSTGKSTFSNFEERSRESDYWEEVHRRDNEERIKEKQLQQETRAAARRMADDLVRAGQTLRPELVERPVTPDAPAIPSIFEGKGDYILLGSTLLLIAVLTAITLVRHRREAEIRLLSGAYLMDGKEAAYFQMPHLFETAQPEVVDEASSPDEADEADGAALPQEHPLAGFFRFAAEQLADMRTALSELGRTVEETERHEILLVLHELIGQVKTRANCWNLRPVWQLTSALELLVQRLVDKAKDATPSTLRTVASAIDLLAELSVPGVRPDLIINPPIAVLAVDDDPLCLRAVMFALQKAEMTPDTAPTGEKAVELAAEKYYDVIFMDIKMPGIDGLEACTQIHKGTRNKATPVVFVTVQSDFHTRAKSTLAGGTDLMAKPFLMFEITVKALTFSMRKRLQLADSLEREVVSQTGAAQLEGAVVLPPPAPTQAPPGGREEASQEAPPSEQSERPETSASPTTAEATVTMNSATNGSTTKNNHPPPPNEHRRTHRSTRRKRKEVIAESPHTADSVSTMP